MDEPSVLVVHGRSEERNVTSLQGGRTRRQLSEVVQMIRNKSTYTIRFTSHVERPPLEFVEMFKEDGDKASYILGCFLGRCLFFLFKKKAQRQ